ncbi:MAG: hypothetical protein Roseis2KO_16080 [Roseivirga sp.]
MKKKPVYIDECCYESLMDALNDRLKDDLKGDFPDLDLFYNDQWLLDSAVVDNLVKVRGNWDVFLVFAHIHFPLKLIRKKITRCNTLKKALFAADKMRRQAAKDQRGTLKIKESSFEYCLN